MDGNILPGGTISQTNSQASHQDDPLLDSAREVSVPSQQRSLPALRLITLPLQTTSSRVTPQDASNHQTVRPPTPSSSSSVAASEPVLTVASLLYRNIISSDEQAPADDPASQAFSHPRISRSAFLSTLLKYYGEQLPSQIAKLQRRQLNMNATGRLTTSREHSRSNVSERPLTPRDLIRSVAISSSAASVISSQDLSSRLALRPDPVIGKFLTKLELGLHKDFDVGVVIVGSVCHLVGFPLRPLNESSSSSYNPPRRPPWAYRPRSTGNAEANATSDQDTEHRRSPKTIESAIMFLYYRSNLGNDGVWPNLQDPHKAPLKYVPLWEPDRADKPSPSQDANEEEGMTDISVESSEYSDDVSMLDYPLHSEPVWPKDRVPAEIFLKVADYLSRDDLKAMRLTCKEFEKFVSHKIFSTVVVPFDIHIFDKLGGKGMGKTPFGGVGGYDSPSNHASDTTDVDIDQGKDAFCSFGPQINRYGMTFEITEAHLARVPEKKRFERVHSYWGSYLWPKDSLQRFDLATELESLAGETWKLRTAFSQLTAVTELALSMDAGLGWLQGPDVSIVDQVLGQPSTIFGTSHHILDRKRQAKIDFWALLSEHYNFGRESTESSDTANIRCSSLFRMPWSTVVDEVGADALLQKFVDDESLSDSTCFLEQDLIHSLEVPLDVKLSNLLRSLLTTDEMEKLLQSTQDLTISPNDVSEIRKRHKIQMKCDAGLDDAMDGFKPQGVIFAAYDPPERDFFTQHPLTPRTLTDDQKEWLLEVGWAQSMFLQSYAIAVIDNPAAFANVHTLRLSKLSARFVPSMCRDDFWDALPALNTVTVKVIADWRTIEEKFAGQLEMSDVRPSDSMGVFSDLLGNYISDRPNITTLEAGWISGGEHASGMYARNKHIMPAPILPYRFLEQKEQYLEERYVDLIHFPHVEHFTLSNCWFTPHSLVKFVYMHQHLSLKKLTLDSVSLSELEILRQGDGSLSEAPEPINTIMPPPATGPGPDAAPAIDAAGNAVPAVVSDEPLGSAGPSNHGSQGIDDPLEEPFDIQAMLENSHRKGSWPWVIDRISPGKILADYEEDHPEEFLKRAAASCLDVIEFKSCGHVSVPSEVIYQYAPIHGMEAIVANHEYWAARRGALEGCLMSTTDPYMGTIWQCMPFWEEQCLAVVWECTFGWENDALAEESTFDGVLAGGTMRFSGVVRKSDRDEFNLPME